jgi:methylenetetrahydrofolate dehydrogenase (NADP+)/methenyltetrahydrofolate cyclohydrolase
MMHIKTLWQIIPKIILRFISRKKMPIILDGKTVSEKVLLELTPEIAKINARFYPTKLRLDIVMVGDNPASRVFVNNKKRVGQSLGVEVKVHHFAKGKDWNKTTQGDMSTGKLLDALAELTGNEKVHGIVVQLPLPPHINEQEILDAVPAEKDVDVLGYKAAGKFYTNNKEFLILPSTLAGILRLLREYGIEDFTGKNVVIVGAGKLVGKPAVTYFMRREASASAFNVRSKTLDKKRALRMADIIISGAGNPKLITGDMVKNGVIIIDAGMTKDPGTQKLVGDVDFETVVSKASYITPVPGGVGPMTVAMIFYNLVELAKQRLEME